MKNMTKSDIEALNNLPEGWFELEDVSVIIARPAYRLNRLEERGRVLSKPKQPLPVNATRQQALECVRAGRLYKKH